MKDLQEKIGYHFHKKELLNQAITHSSYTNDLTIRKKPNNERLEFLGDAVLQLVSSVLLYDRYPDHPEGDLTKLRASIVCETSLAYAARKIELGKHLLLGKGLNHEKIMEKDAVISDAMEAVIGAIYLDGGFECAKRFVERFILPNLDDGVNFHDNKSVLQEMVQGNNMPDVKYQMVRETGPAHNKTFTVVALIGDKKMGSGQGKTKKSAEQKAAYETIQILKNG